MASFSHPEGCSQYLAKSLPELQALRDEWYAQGKKVARDLRLIVEEFGEDVGSRYTCRIYKTLKRGRLQAWLYESEGPRRLDHYEHRARLWIDIDTVTAANLYFRDGEIATENDSVFIPHFLIDGLLSEASLARERIQARADALNERERQKLIGVLGIGKIV